MATTRQVSASEVAKMASNAAVLASKTAEAAKLATKAFSSATQSALRATANTVLEYSMDDAVEFAGASYTITVAANVIAGASFILSNVASQISKFSGTDGHTLAFTSASLAVAEALQAVSVTVKAVRSAIQACSEAMTTVPNESEPNSVITKVSKANSALQSVTAAVEELIFDTHKAQGLGSLLSVRITGHDLAGRAFISSRGAVTYVGGVSGSIATAKASIAASSRCITKASKSITKASKSIAAACGSLDPASSAISALAKANAGLEEIDSMLVVPAVEGSEVSRHETVGEQGE